MSSLRGEEALKDGLSFEFTWTARHFIEVLEERVDWIRLGGLPSENGVDFILGIKGREEHHQVKRAFGSKGEWKLSNLAAEKVLSDFKQRLANPDIDCHFVSTLPAVQLRYLADRARRSESLELFKGAYLTGEYKAWYEDMVKHWELDEQDCWERLKRVYCRHPDPQETENGSYTMLKYLVDGNPQEAFVHLRDFCFGHLHKNIRSSDIWRWLSTKGVKRSPYSGDSRVLDSLDEQTRMYIEGVRDKLIKPPLPRPIAAQIVEKMTESESGEDVVVLGSPGGGKSAVMLQIVEMCQSKGWPVLAFRLDELSASLTPLELQHSLGLSIPPARAVAFASAGKHALVVIDQLDAVSEYSGRTGALHNRVNQLIRELRGYRMRNPIHVVIACREVDWQYDGKLRELHSRKQEGSQEEKGIYKIEPLSDGEIKTLLSNNGMDAAAFSPQQYEQLLRRPQYLAVLIETHPSNEDLPKIITPKKLFDAYWSKKEREMSMSFPQWTHNPWHQILNHITARLSEVALAIAPPPDHSSLEEDAPLAISRKSMQDFSPLALSWMISNGVLAESKCAIRFGHESFFDYCFARFFEERNETLLEYLIRSDQTLIQRGQLRQVMAYLRDEKPSEYLNEAQQILESGNVRQHLKQLLIALLCQANDPTPEEWKMLLPYLQSSLIDFDQGRSRTLACQVFYAFSMSLPLFQLAVRSGVFAGWLRGWVGTASIERLFRVMLKHQGTAQELVWQLIEPLRGHPRFESSLKFLSRFCKAAKSRQTFEWLLDEMRDEFEKNDEPSQRWERFYSLGEDLAMNQPAWLAEWMASLIRARSSLKEPDLYELIKDHSISSKSVEAAALTAPVEFVTHIVPALIQTLETSNTRFLRVWMYGDDWSDNEKNDKRHTSTDVSLVRSVVQALRSVVSTHPEVGGELLLALQHSQSDACRKIYAAVLCGGGANTVARAADFLAHDEKAFSLTYGRELAACIILKKHAKRFNKNQLMEIESTVLSCFPRWQNRRRDDYLDERKKQCVGNDRGYQQMLVLRVFPPGSLSETGEKRLVEWERKFNPLGRKTSVRTKDRPINFGALSAWNPADYHYAIGAYERRVFNPYKKDRFDGGGKFAELMKEAVKVNPEAYIKYLRYCDIAKDEVFLRVLAEGLSASELTADIAELAVLELYGFGDSWAPEVVSLFAKIPALNLSGPVFEILMTYATTLPAPTISVSNHKDGKRGEYLHRLAINCMRGKALEVLRDKLWENPELISRITTQLDCMMIDPNAAIRVELASVCYAIAFTQDYRPFSIRLFTALATKELPEPHVLASYWPVKFIQDGLHDHWQLLRPILESMIVSGYSEVQATAARLVCIAVVSGINAFDLAGKCVASEDPKVRSACADVLSHNLDAVEGRPWTLETFLKLADDVDQGVCEATGSGLYHGQRNDPLDFSLLGDLLQKFSRTRAFVFGPSNLIEAIGSSRSVLPDTVFDIVQSLIDRIDEVAADEYNHLAFHVEEASSLLKKLYHENRDSALRRRALDMIDVLCVDGRFDSSTLDE